MQIIDPAGGITALNYTNGKLSSITDPQGRGTTVSIDANGDLRTITDPDGSVSNYNYDSNHLMTSKTLPGNKSFSYAYDTHGMVSSINLPDASGSRKSYKHSTGMELINDITLKKWGQVYLVDIVCVKMLIFLHGTSTSHRISRSGLSHHQ